MRIDLPLPTLGLDQLSDETRLAAGAVRSAVNVDIDRDGQIKRRDGHIVVGSGVFTGVVSFGGYVYVGQGSSLYLLDQGTYALTFLCDMGIEARFTTTEYNGYLYVLGPAARWRFNRYAPTTPLPVGVSLPALLPEVEAVPSGSLTPGSYGVAISLVNVQGEESPAAFLGNRTLTAGLRLTNLTVTPDHFWRVYITPPDGDVLYLAEEFSASLTTYGVSVYPDGAPCTTLNLDPLPTGHIIRARSGRMYVASGDAVWFSEALRPHLTSLRHNFVSFAGKIRMMEAVEGGLYVGDSRGVWFLAGDDPTKYVQQSVSAALAVPMSALLVPAAYFADAVQAKDDCAVWLSADGYMVGTPDGAVTALHSDRIRIDPSVTGRSVFLSRDGIKQVITLTAASSATPPGVAIDTATH